MTITPEIEDLLRGFLNDPGITIFDAPRNYVFPEIATIRVVDIQGSAARLDAQFTGANYEVDLGDVGGLNQLLSRLATELPAPIRMPDSAIPKRKFKTPLSLQNRKHAYIIIKLAGKNWQFSHDKAPFSLSIEAAKTGAYLHARKVDPQGRIVDPGTPTPNCKIAFFVAEGHNVWNGTDPFSHGFNLHLDLRYKDWANQDSFMPIIIDPDVRYPGGSGVDPDP